MSDLLALDPGRDKIGAAVLSFKSEEKEKTIIKKEELLDHLEEVFSHYQIKDVVIGSGTGAEEVRKMIESKYPGLKISLVAEEYTTEEAQARYLKEKPMSNYEKLLRKIVSWKVQKALDDYAALIIGEKYLEKLDKND